MNNLIFVIVGVSGSGKTILSDSVEGLGSKIVTSTTRSARNGEIDGIDYHFISNREFLPRSFIESDIKYDNCYGTEVSEVENKLSNGNVYAILTHDGYLKFKERYNDRVVGVFVYASKSDVRRMLDMRGDADVDKRMTDYESDLASMTQYEYVVKNEFGRLSDAVSDLSYIVNFKKSARATV